MYYFDNSATTFKKPKEVYENIIEALERYSANPSRGSHRLALIASKKIYEARESIGRFFGVKNPLNIAFTYNATYGLNMVIGGVLKKGDHIVTTSYEHNSVLRPIYALEREGVSNTIVYPKGEELTLEDIRSSIKEDTKVVVVTHSSNLIGGELPIKEIGRYLKDKDILFIVDGSQSAGTYDIDVEEQNIDILCVTGHKGLYGPQGVGVVYVREGIKIENLLSGGSGSNSKERIHPKNMPDLLEYGTLNVPGILGLKAGVEYLEKIGTKKVREHKKELLEFLYSELEGVDSIKFYGKKSYESGIVSLNIKGIDSKDLTTILDEDFDICVRGGFHCAPLAHKTLGTYDSGSVRISVSYLTTLKEIRYLVEALKEIGNHLN